MKKLLSLLLALAMFAGLALPAMAEEPVTIEFWYSFENQMVEQIMTVIAAFEEANPGIKVKATYAGSYNESNQKLLAAHAANAVPAVQQTVQTSIATFAENGVLAPIDQYIAANNDDMSVYAKGMYEAYSYNGQQYGVPAFCSVCPTMYYNKTFATNEGIEIPTTWEEFDAFLRKATVKDENGNTTRYGCSFAGWGSAYFGPIFWENGVEAFEDEEMTKTGLGSEKAVNVIKMLKGWVDEGLVKWCYGTNASTNMRQSLIDGTSFAVFHTCAVYSVYQPALANNGYEVGVAFPPSGEKTIADLGDKIDSADKSDLEAKINALKEALKGTDADAIASVRTGVPSGLVSIPLKYMHTPTEVVQLSDVEDVGRLLAAYVLDMEKEGSRR